MHVMSLIVLWVLPLKFTKCDYSGVNMCVMA